MPGALVDTSLDVTAALLPFAAASTLEGRTLSGLGDDSGIDGVIVRFTGFSADGSAEWWIALPPGVTTFTLPTLPAAWRDPLAFVERFVDVYYYDSDFTAGYPAFRALVHTTDPHDPFGYLDTAPTGATGVARVSIGRLTSVGRP